MCTNYFFFFNDTATTEIYTLSLHDALPISYYFYTDQLMDVEEARRLGLVNEVVERDELLPRAYEIARWMLRQPDANRSEEHTSELQSRQYLVCRLLLEKKKKNNYV